MYLMSNGQMFWRGYFFKLTLLNPPLDAISLSESIWSTCSLLFPINSLVCELNLNKKDILFWDEVARLGLGSPVSVCLSARPAVMQPSLERQTENVQPLFWKARPAGMIAPKTASDGSEACEHYGAFWCESTTNSKTYVNTKNIGSLWCHNKGWLVLERKM